MTEKITMDVIHPKAAGIDVGSKSHFISIGQGENQVREFGVYTDDHNQAIQWLKETGITTVAMESTGSYWQTLFTALQIAGFEVLLVNGRDVKNLKGKKTDVLDCQWIQRLHSLGLLRGSFLSNEFSRQLRSYYHHRQSLIRQCSKYTNKMQKALRLMNIRLDIAIRDINGKTGKSIIKAIIDGERNPKKLASLADVRVKKSKEEIALSLEGEWKDDLIFILSDCFSIYNSCQERIKECDKKLKQLLTTHVVQSGIELPPLKSKLKKKSYKNCVSFNLRPYAYQILGVDLYDIQNISHNTVLSVLSMVGNGINKFPTSKHFVSWLRLAPNNKVSGGKIISSRTPKGKNQLSIALRQAANTIGNSKNHPLKSYFSRIAFKKGRGAAITAVARKLAVIIYNMIVKKQPYNPSCINESFIKSRKILQVRKTIQRLNLTESEMSSLF